MNTFQKLVAKLEDFATDRHELDFYFDEPVRPEGRWVGTIVADDDYMLEVTWSRHLGFGISAGSKLDFGGGVEETFDSADLTLNRITELVEQRAETQVGALSLAELRKLRGVLQKDAAERLGMSKSGLNQIEKSGDLQLSTLRRVIESFGGELVVMARFNQGEEQELAL